MAVIQRSRAKKTTNAPADTEPTQALTDSVGASLQSIAGLTVPFEQMSRIQQDYVEQAGALWNQALENPGQLQPDDRRFAAPAWTSNPGSAFMASMYLLNARTLQRMADSLSGDEKAKERIRFAVQQWVDAASPSNFLALNPEAQKRPSRPRARAWPMACRCC